MPIGHPTLPTFKKSNYYFYITENFIEIGVTPSMATPSVSYDKTKEFQRDYVPKFNAKLTFSTPHDFNLLIKYQNTQNQCSKLPFTIKRDCNGSRVVWGTGYLFLLNGTWDLDRCVVELPISITNKYFNYDFNKDTEINLFDAVVGNNRRTATYTLGTIEKKMFTANVGEEMYTTRFFGVDPRTKGWILYRYELLIGNIGSIGYNYYYAREVYIQPSATVMPSDWILVEDNTAINNTKTWARQPMLNNYTKLYVNNLPPAANIIVRTKTQLFTTDILGDNGFPGKIDNGMSLGEVLPYFINKFCQLTFKSDFFQINPVNISNINYVTGLATLVDDILIFQKSDVKRPNSSDNARNAKFTLGKLIEGLCKMFNLQYRINNGVFELEHVSFFSRELGLDLTIPKYSQYIKAKRKYTFKTGLISKYEELKFQEANGADFVGVPIEYAGTCVNLDEGEQRKTITAEEITTDVAFCISNFDADNNSVSDDGIVLIACYVDGTKHIMRQEKPIIDTVAQPNNTLAVAQLEDKYWKHERLLKEAIMNNNVVAFSSAIPIKKGVKISIPVCCDETVSLGNFFRTELGDGIVESASMNMIQNMLDLELLYPDPIGGIGTGGGGTGGGGGGGTAVCYRPKTFVITSLTGSTFNFNTEFFDNNFYETQDEITYPSGNIQIKTNSALQHTFPGYSIHILSPVEPGTYKFRKRLKCADGTWSSWTDYTIGTIVAAPPAGCANLPEPVSYLGLTGNRNQPTFEISVAVSETIKVEYRHHWLLGWTNWKQAVVLLQTNNGTATTIIAGIPPFGKMKKGRWQFRFQRICSSGNSAITSSVEFRI